LAFQRDEEIPLIQFLTRNWATKLVSLVLAVGLWYYAVGEERVEVTRTIPVELKMEKEKLSVVGKPVRLVLVTLQAPRSLLANLASEELKAEHPIKKVEGPGDYSFRLEPREIRLPSDKIRVVRIEPEVIQVKIDEMIVQKLEIEPVFLGEPAFGYRIDLERVQLDPTSVLVEAPKSQLENLGKIRTQPIDVVGRVRSFRKTVRLAEEPGMKLLSESLVDAYVPLEEALAEKTFENIPVKVLGSADSFSRLAVESAEVNLVLQGSPKTLEGLQSGDLLAYVEISGLEEGTHNIPLKTILPEGTFLKETPPTAKVTIQRKGAFS
jgi:YbbR domain-containing protein